MAYVALNLEVAEMLFLYMARPSYSYEVTFPSIL